MPAYDYKPPRTHPRARTSLARGAGAPVIFLLFLALGAALSAGPPTHPALPETPPVVSEETPPPLPEQVATPVVPAPEPAPVTHLEGRIKRNEVFSEALKREGVGHEQVFDLVRALRKGIHRDEFNPNIVQAGDAYEVVLDSLDQIQGFEFVKRGQLATRYVVSRENGALSARKEEVPLERRVLVISEDLHDTMWGALSGSGEDPGVLTDLLTDIFEYEIDFMVDCRPGDRFSVVFEAFYNEGERVRYGDVLAAEYRSARESFQAFRFEDAEGRGTYYDEAGKSLRGIFLKSPLNYRRISSGFSSRRFHPVLKKYLAHHGIDYAADYGTPVWATADGTVTFVGRKGALGNYVEVVHKNGYKTGYGHLSGFARGLRKGSVVREKQTVGYVGATGRATGPHLHYNFYALRNGTYQLTNPSAVVRPTGKPIPGSQQDAFTLQRDALYALLDHTSGTEVTALADARLAQRADAAYTE